MRSLVVAKYQLRRILSSILAFYLVYVLVTGAVSILGSINNGVSSTGTDMASMVFILVAGLCCFKESFLFSQSCGVSRKSFYLGTALAAFPLSLGMALADFVINRIANLMIPIVPIHQMIYNQAGPLYESTTISDFQRNWYPSWDVAGILQGLLWTIALFCFMYFLGMLISLIFYRSGKLLKGIIGVGSWAFLVVALPLLAFWFPEQAQAVGQALYTVFLQNAWIAALGFAVLAAFFAGDAYLLVRRAVIKR